MIVLDEKFLDLNKAETSTWISILTRWNKCMRACTPSVIAGEFYSSYKFAQILGRTNIDYPDDVSDQPIN
jgi:hypothetical protein